MSKLSKYGVLLNKLAESVFAEIQSDEKALRDAENRMHNAVPGLEKERAVLEYKEAVNASRKSKSDIASRARHEIAKLRSEFAAAAEDIVAADPTKLDSATLDLLKSGILKPSEYERLLNRAAADDNTTMCRIIGKYAADAAESCKDEKTSYALRAVSYKAPAQAKDYLDTFDSISNIMNRCMDNSSIISHWEEFTAPLMQML